MDADDMTSLIYGFKHLVTKNLLRKAIEDGTLNKHLHKENIVKGDVYYVSVGSVYGIRAGTLIVEIQKSSNVTCRAYYSYDRIDKNGKKRENLFDKAIEFMNTKAEADISQKTRLVHFS